MSRRPGRGTAYGLVAAWAVVAAGGWGVAQWLGEPAATSGPGRVAPPVSDAEPGPQPEIGDGGSCGEFRARSGASGAYASPSPSPFPGASGKAMGDEAHAYTVQCSTVVVRDGWREADE